MKFICTLMIQKNNEQKKRRTSNEPAGWLRVVEMSAAFVNPYADDAGYKQGLRCMRVGVEIPAAIEFFVALCEERYCDV